MLAWMRNGTRKTVTASLVKTLAAGVVTVAGMLPSNHDIALTTAVIFVIGTIAYSTG